MSEFVEIIGRDGKRRRARKGEVLADGEKFSLPLRFMDAVMRDALAEKFGGPARVVDTSGAPAGNRPGFIGLDRDTALADAAEQAYRDRMARIDAKARKRRQPDDDDDEDDDDDGGAAGRRQESETERRERLAIKAARATQGSDAEAAYFDKCARLSAAWRTR